MLPISRHLRLGVWILGGIFIAGASGCRFGYEVQDVDDSVGVGGGSGDGDVIGDGDLATAGGTAGDGDFSTGGDASAGGTGGPASGGAGMGGNGAGFDCALDALFCSGFEVALLDEWSEINVTNTNCVVEPGTTQVFSGGSSLYAFGPGSTNVARLTYHFEAPISSGALSVRGWFFVPSSTSLSDEVVILELHDETLGFEGKASINLGANDTVILEATTGISPVLSTSAAGAFNRDEWNCAVVRATVGDSGSLEVDVNGTTVHSIAGDTLTSSGFARAMVGLYKTGNVDVAMYFDDVAVAQSALSCP